MTAAHCDGCGQVSVLLPLHGGKGGPLRCPLCVGAWNAEHGRKRRTGRIVIRAIKAFQDAGGTDRDIDKLKFSDFSYNNFGLDPLGYMTGIAQMDEADIDLTSELLADVLQLTHPDHHPPERQQLAHSVTQRLLALQPFVFPAPEPKPSDSKPSTRERARKPEPEPEPEPEPFRYPCPDCADTTPYFYCDACKAEWEKREHEEDEARRAKQRAWYAKRPKMWTPPRKKGAPKPRTERQSVRLIKPPGSNLVNHKLSGLQAAILVTACTKRVPGSRGCDVSYPELLAEIWGWEPCCELRWTKENITKFNRNLFRVGDTLAQSDTYGAFSHIIPHLRRAARVSLSRALTRLQKRMLISFVSGTGCYSGGLVLTPHGEQIARSLAQAPVEVPTDDSHLVEGLKATSNTKAHLTTGRKRKAATAAVTDRSAV
jgi:hypothetical protein